MRQARIVADLLIRNGFQIPGSAIQLRHSLAGFFLSEYKVPSPSRSLFGGAKGVCGTRIIKKLINDRRPLSFFVSGSNRWKRAFLLA